MNFGKVSDGHRILSPITHHDLHGEIINVYLPLNRVCVGPNLLSLRNGSIEEA